MLRHKIQPDLNARFFILQAATAAICCVGASFIAPVLMAYGYGPMEIGVALTLAALFNMFAKPLWGYLHDKYSRSRQTVLFAMFAGCLFFALLALSGGQKPLAHIAVIGIAVTISSMVSFVDSWAMRLISEGYDLNYGATRSGGSLMFAFTAAGFGVVMDLFGAKPGIIVLALLYAVLALAARGIPNPKQTLQNAPDKSLKDCIRYLLNNRPYVALVLTYFVGTMCICASDGFLSLRIAELGGSDAHIGLGMFVQAMAEIPVMLLYKRIKARWK
ncbi:MAG TPA: MFS transporter, partial [Feifaniaceae bacterium]|nr:MFS transporter [Feifaniaceae bacterium]